MYFPKSRFKSLLNGHSNKKERKKKSHGNIFVGILIMPAAVRNICPGTGHNNCATNKTKRLFVNPKSFTFNGFYIYIMDLIRDFYSLAERMLMLLFLIQWYFPIWNCDITKFNIKKSCAWTQKAYLEKVCIFGHFKFVLCYLP